MAYVHDGNVQYIDEKNICVGFVSCVVYIDVIFMLTLRD